jgi:hypothetical protein
LKIDFYNHNVLNVKVASENSNADDDEELEIDSEEKINLLNEKSCLEFLFRFILVFLQLNCKENFLTTFFFFFK